MVLVMQLIFGGSGIRDFVSVMLYGVIIGTYSSIFLTNLIISYWHKPVLSVREETKKEELPENTQPQA